MKISQVLKISFLLILFVGQEVGAFQGLAQYLFSIKSTAFPCVRSKMQERIDFKKVINFEKMIESVKRNIKMLIPQKNVAVEVDEQNLSTVEESQQNVCPQGVAAHEDEQKRLIVIKSARLKDILKIGDTLRS